MVGTMAKIDNSVKKKVPELRFKGFTDDWEERKLSDIADRFDNLRVPITASDRKPGDTPYYGANGIQDYVEGFTHNGEFILVAEDGANDLKNYPVQYVNGKVWVNNHAHVLQGKKTITDNKFLMNAIKNFNIEPFLVGGGRAKLNADVMMKLNILLPTFVEQQKIGAFFKQLDDIIALHQRKLDLLKEQKKGFLQKMFPKNGAKVPELRFKGFTDDWEERKLGNLSQDTIGGGTPKTSVTEYWNGEIPWIQSSDLANDKLYGVLPKKFITEDAVKNSATKLIPANSIAIVTRVGVGKLAFMPYEFASSQDFLSLSNLQVDCNFGMYSIYKMLQRELNNIQGTSIKGITKADLLDKETFVPIKVEEQQKIGSFFKQLDDIIALHQRKLDLLKEQKKGFLQKMFV